MKPNNITNPHLDEDIRRKSRYLIAFVLVLLGILILRLFFMQIINGSYYEELSRNNRVRIIPIPAPRGKIFDRDGVVLADNRPAFNVMVLPEDISKPEDTLAAMSEPMPGDTPSDNPGESAPDAPTEAAQIPSDDSQSEAAATVEPSVSADGATRLLVTAYIGIGNKLYIRGDGPGLSWDKGVPMKFVSIGKWGWATDDATGPVACKLYKNDETAALSGEVFLEPGQHVEVTALF